MTTVEYLILAIVWLLVVMTCISFGRTLMRMAAKSRGLVAAVADVARAVKERPVENTAILVGAFVVVGGTIAYVVPWSGLVSAWAELVERASALGR